VPSQPPVPPSDADTERLLALLREHYARGHLDEAGLDQRVGAVLRADSVAAADAALAGLPPLTGPAAGSGTGGGPGKRQPRPRRRGHAQAERPAPGWVPTAERFRDPTSEVVMRVWIDPADGSRHYLPDR
jgi:hypothetical protein